MDRIETYKKIVEVNKRKQEHLKQYKSYIENIARNKSQMLILTGSCDECDKYDKEILELEKLLGI